MLKTDVKNLPSSYDKSKWHYTEKSRHSFLKKASADVETSVF